MGARGTTQSSPKSEGSQSLAARAGFRNLQPTRFVGGWIAGCSFGASTAPFYGAEARPEDRVGARGNPYDHGQVGIRAAAAAAGMGCSW